MIYVTYLMYQTHVLLHNKICQDIVNFPHMIFLYDI